MKKFVMKYEYNGAIGMRSVKAENSEDAITQLHKHLNAMHIKYDKRKTRVTSLSEAQVRFSQKVMAEKFGLADALNDFKKTN